MCSLQNTAMCDYQESVTTRQTDDGQSDPYVQFCFAYDTIVATFRGMHVSLQNIAMHDYQESVTTGQNSCAPVKLSYA